MVDATYSRGGDHCLQFLDNREQDTRIRKKYGSCFAGNRIT